MRSATRVSENIPPRVIVDQIFAQPLAERIICAFVSSDAPRDDERASGVVDLPHHRRQRAPTAGMVPSLGQHVADCSDIGHFHGVSRVCRAGPLNSIPLFYPLNTFADDHVTTTLLD
jgi:hypothetical protein